MKKRRDTILLAVALCAVCVALLLVALHMRNNGIQDEKMRVTVLKVGKADAIVVESGGQCMVIDTGELDNAEKVVKFLRKRGITTINTMLITHYDKDHVGGAEVLVEDFLIEQVLVPDYEGKVEGYFGLMEALQAASIAPTAVTDTVRFTLGEAEVCVQAPVDYGVDDVINTVADYDNTLSLMATITCGEKRFLFAADADRRRLNDWLEHGEVGHYDFLKVPHHGNFNASLELLLQATTPQYAAITCSKKNPADEATVALLQQYNVETLLTKDGRITVLTDGDVIELRLN